MRTIEQVEYKGCKINIHQDESPENSFEAWDCEPPLLVCYDGRPKAYQNAPENWRELLHLIPDTFLDHHKRVEFIKEHLSWLSMREVVELKNEFGYLFDAFSQALEDKFGSEPRGWRGAIEWMDTACAILNWGGITAACEQSNGYSQGDSTLCLAIATPEWLEKTGIAKENEKAQLESAIQLYGWWAWGDVYGYTLEDENGDELEDSCWGFYGSNHIESGLIEQAQAAIDGHLANQTKEAETLNAAFTF